jgi:hypothetical protein
MDGDGGARAAALATATGTDGTTGPGPGRLRDIRGIVASGSSGAPEIDMDGIVLLAIVAALFIVLGAAAAAYGVDSRFTHVA